jgi:hypothetical protein
MDSKARNPIVLPTSGKADTLVGRTIESRARKRRLHLMQPDARFGPGFGERDDNA